MSAAAARMMVATLFDGPTPGLDLHERLGAIEGTYADFTASISFVFTADADVRTAVIRDIDGHRIVESTIADGLETTTYLNKLTISGPPLSVQPKLFGAPSAMAELRSDVNRYSATAVMPQRLDRSGESA